MLNLLIKFFKKSFNHLENKFIQYKKTTTKNEYNSKVFSVYFFFVLILLLIFFRIIYLNVTNFKFNFTADEKSFKRALIVDDEDNVLAFSEPRYNVYLNGKTSTLAQTEIAPIADELNLKEENIAKIMEEKKIVLLKRFTTQNYVKEILKINKDNLFLIDKVNYRRYPYKSLLAQTLGFVGHDGKGLTGLEFKYEDELKYNDDEVSDKKVVLNVNKDFARELEIILKNSVIQNEAKSGSIIVQEIDTGKVIGIANYPSFDLNNFVKQNQYLFKNLSISTTIDPGSIFKIIFIGYLIEKFNLDVKEKKYFCRGYYELENGEIIKCHAHHGEVSLEDIIKFSCNAGIIEATEIISNEEMYAFLKKMLIGEKSDIDLPGEAKSKIPPLNEWGLRTRATIPLGQGISISPIQLSAIFSAFIGDGKILQPQIVKEIQFTKNGYEKNNLITKPKVMSEVIKESTAQDLVELLILGTIKGSTGSSSRSTGLQEVFGKTGTSQLVNLRSGGYYIDRYDSIFAGGYPSSDPKYSILVIVNEPKKEYYGGKVAAPIYAEVIEKLIFYYQLTNERIIEKYNQELIAQNVYNEKVVSLFGDTVPNFMNLSLRSSLELFANFKKVANKKIKLKTEGNGFVFKQTPPASSEIKDNDEITLFFK